VWTFNRSISKSCCAVSLDESLPAANRVAAIKLLMECEGAQPANEKPAEMDSYHTAETLTHRRHRHIVRA
jgi:hypothetical protein